MPWGEVTPEQLKKAGLDPDEFKTMSDKIKTAATKEDVDAVKSSLTDIQNSLKALTDKSQLGGGSGSTDGSGGNNGGSNDGTNNGGDNNRGKNDPPDPFNIDPVTFMEDPAGNIKKIVQSSIAGTQIHSLTLAADMAYNNAKSQLPHFKIFEEEIKKEWDKYTIVQKGRPVELIENIYYLVKGRHAEDIMTDTAKKEGKYNIVQAGGTSIIRNDNSGGTSKPEDNMTPAEIRAAQSFGMTPEEWTKSKGGLKYV